MQIVDYHHHINSVVYNNSKSGSIFNKVYINLGKVLDSLNFLFQTLTSVVFTS